MTDAERERGYVEQWCESCGLVCTGSTTNRDRADDYDKRCPRCGLETMRVRRWVSVSGARER